MHQGNPQQGSEQTDPRKRKGLDQEQRMVVGGRGGRSHSQLGM